MNLEEATRLIQTGDADLLADRALRLLELDELLEGDWQGPYSSSLDETLFFEDIKATWIYGFFTSTIVGAHAYCRLQLMNSLNLAGSRPFANDAEDLSQLAGQAASAGLITAAEHARLLELEDLHRIYTRASGPTAIGLALEGHLDAKESAFGETPQLADARDATRIATQFAIRWHSD